MDLWPSIALFLAFIVVLIVFILFVVPRWSRGTSPQQSHHEPENRSDDTSKQNTDANTNETIVTDTLQARA